MKTVLFVFIISKFFLVTKGGLGLETLRFCCGLGNNYANSNLKCDSFQAPIAGIKREDEQSCISSVLVCCNNQKQKVQCDEGIEALKNGQTCEKFAADTGGSSDCCEACQLGQDAAIASENCNENPGLVGLLFGAFKTCCKDYNKNTTTTAITSSTTTSSTTTMANVVSDLPPTAESHKSNITTRNDFSPLPPIENVCDIGDVCAQICVPIGDSYKCGCNKGFTLMSDGISCKPDKRSTKKTDRCTVNNPCDHDCIDTGLAIKCSCREGYELAKDKRTCKDIDECALGIHECTATEVCVNDEGSYFCDDPNFEPETDFSSEDINTKCPVGYKFNYKNMVCDDIDECEFDIICPRPKVCINTIGSFKCEEEDRCPPGFYYKTSIETCADIDECVTGKHDCNKESQVCLNTIGNYTCTDKVSKKTCPPGFKKNPLTQNCDDINECEENDEPCRPNEQCINEPGGHNCVPSNKIRPYPLPPPPEPTLPSPPFRVDSDEILTPSNNLSSSTISTTKIDLFTGKPATCQRGFRYSSEKQDCEDIDECIEDEQSCDSTQNCYNTMGSYICNCKIGFQKDYQTGACIDVNECQIGSHDCTFAQRCDNTIGSYLCARITGCGTGYTLNYANGLCEDDDECVLGTHQCKRLGDKFKCRNTLGSYRCELPRQPLPTSKVPSDPSQPTKPQNTIRPIYISSRPTLKPIVPLDNYPVATTSFFNYPILSGTLKRCLPGYKMSPRGTCEDINECESNPCPKRQSCLNFNGGYDCVPALQCKLGYEPDDAGEKCVDVNECSKGTHKCKSTQICKNGQGYYTCECPPGHHLNQSTQLCEDIDECKYYRACSLNADCINTIGSYKCRCKEGFKENGHVCEDRDECRETSGLCEHTCVNIWGSYRCACRPGFTLNFDNRTCNDVDECTKFNDTKLCVGTCENIPGSYKCTCPQGYRLGSEGRTCIDIDECAQNPCPRQDDVCLNTRGSFKCFTINCPANYMRDPQHKGRCKTLQTFCDPRDFQCIAMPEQYTYHYITLVSNLPVSDANIKLFEINGPQWSTSRADFSMKVEDVKCPYDVQRVDERFFKMIKPRPHVMQLYLVRSIRGPQEIQLKIEMYLFRDNIMTSKVVSYIYIVVSEYPF